MHNGNNINKSIEKENNSGNHTNSVSKTKKKLSLKIEKDHEITTIKRKENHSFLDLVPTQIPFSHEKINNF